MPSLSESFPSRPIHDALTAGLDVLGGPQLVTFIPYVRITLPLDGFVFLVNASLLSPAQLAQSGLFSANSLTVEGSLHYATQGTQSEEQTIVVRRVDFTSETDIGALAELSSTVLYIGTWQTSLGPFRFSFSQLGAFYREADLFHYGGDAIYPVFETQIIDTLDGFSDRQVVSNSLPIWLNMLRSPPFPSDVLPSPQFLPIESIFPSYLVPTNQVPPYVSIEITDTHGLQGAPLLGKHYEHSQLCAERVRLTLYGFRNQEVLDFQDYVLNYSFLTDNLIGIMNVPVVYDDHRHQVVLAVLAMKKTLDVEVSYYQHAARNIARQYIESVGLSILPEDYGPAPDPGPVIIPPGIVVPAPSAPPAFMPIKLGMRSSYTLEDGLLINQEVEIIDNLYLASSDNPIAITCNSNVGSTVIMQQPGQALRGFWDGTMWNFPSFVGVL